MKRIVGLILTLLVIIFIIISTRAAAIQGKRESAQSLKLPAISKIQAAERLSSIIQIETISQQYNSQIDQEAFNKLHQYLEVTFPSMHSKLKKEIVGSASLLYRWEGKNNSLKPALLLAHQDVVPIEPGTEKLWKSPPFEGKVLDGKIYGRGALDDKTSLSAISEAVDLLVNEGYQPQRTIYFGFGHDEELGGTGAIAMAALFKSRGIQLESVLDEGMMILESEFAGITKPKALIGIAEKGFLTLELKAKAEGGHSSMPPAQTAVGILSAAILKLEQNQMPARLEGPVGHMIDTFAPQMPFRYRLIFANLWLFEPLVLSNLQKSPTSNALVRTTTAPTMLQGSPKDNVLATEAKGVINFRILPGDTVQSVQDHVRKVIDDRRITINVVVGNEPSPESDIASQAYDKLAQTILGVFPEAIPGPGLVIGATDARHFTGLSKNVYRFLPVQIQEEEISTIHGTNERIDIDSYAKSIQFYYAYLKQISN